MDRAQRQFQVVEPENRLVARTLENNWEAALRDHERCQTEYEDFKRAQPSQLTGQQRELVKQLSQDTRLLAHSDDDATGSAEDCTPADRPN